MTGDHYFSATPAAPADFRRVAVTLAGRSVEVTTARGVFSPDHVDGGTAVLLAATPPPPASGDLLDLGAGWGPIALALALESPDAAVWAVDVNERALDLVRRNAEDLALDNVNVALPDDVPPGVSFATIRSNPPIRIGKAELHALLERWLPRLAPGGDAWLVVRRDLGADSLERWLAASGWRVERIALSKGFRVLRVTATGAGQARSIDPV